MSRPIHRFFILTGDPGVGKTTLTKKITSLLATQGVKVSGFITEEVRKNGVREGFDVVTCEGTRGRLARDQGLISSPVKHRVGKYGVLVQDFEEIALPCLYVVSQQSLLVIDEIGKMELFSEKFKNTIREIFGDNSTSLVLATIPIRRSRDTLVENIRKHPKTKLWTVTRENRNKIHEEIISEIKSALS